MYKLESGFSQTAQERKEEGSTCTGSQAALTRVIISLEPLAFTLSFATLVTG
jgi:hypothetical protein